MLFNKIYYVLLNSYELSLVQRSLHLSTTDNEITDTFQPTDLDSCDNFMCLGFIHLMKC